MLSESMTTTTVSLPQSVRYVSTICFSHTLTLLVYRKFVRFVVENFFSVLSMLVFKENFVVWFGYRVDPKLFKDDTEVKYCRTMNSCRIPQVRFYLKVYRQPLPVHNSS